MHSVTVGVPGPEACHPRGKGKPAHDGVQSRVDGSVMAWRQLKWLDLCLSLWQRRLLDLLVASDLVADIAVPNNAPKKMANGSVS